MTSNYNDIVKQGYVRIKGGKVGLFKKKWMVLRKASSTGPCRMEKYVDEVSAKYGVNKKEVPVDQVRDICRLPPDIKKCAFVTITSENLSQQFAAESDVEADDWVNSLRKLLLIDQNSRTNEPDVVSSGLELNMKNIYHVCLLPSTKLDFHGECLIQVTSESIHLFDTDDPTKRLVTWPIRSLRRYGQDSGKFTFETGRACETGDGMFGVASKDCDTIYNLVNDNAHAIASRLSEMDTPEHSKPLHSDGSTSSSPYYYGSPTAGKHKPPKGRPLPPPPPDTDF